MKIALFLVATICVAASVANPLAVDRERIQSGVQCISAALNDLETRLRNLKELGEDVVDTLEKLREQRDYCESKNGENLNFIQQKIYE